VGRVASDANVQSQWTREVIARGSANASKQGGAQH
jgi:hypothetical protein